MGFLKRVLGGGEPSPEPGPDWAAPMSAEEATRLVEAVDDDLTRRGVSFARGEGFVRVERPEPPAPRTSTGSRIWPSCATSWAARRGSR